MREQIDEVEHARANSVGGEEAAEPALQIIRLLRRGDLLVTHRHLLSQLGELCPEQIALVRV